MAVPGFSYKAEAVATDLADRLAARLRPVASAERTSMMVHVEDFDSDAAELLRACAAQGLITGPCDWLQFLCYPDGVGFSAHLDSAHRWGPRIVALSLGAPTELLLQKAGAPTVRQLLEPRSAYVLTGEARYAWKHGISRRLRGGVRLGVVLRTSRLFARAAYGLGCGPDWTEEEARVYATDHDGRRLSAASVARGTEHAAQAVIRALELMD